MRGWALLASGLALAAGCAGEPLPPDETPLPPGPLPGETFADPGDPDVEACLTVVSLYTRSFGLVATGVAEVPDGRIVSVSGDLGRWRCRIDDGGRVMAMLPL